MAPSCPKPPLQAPAPLPRLSQPALGPQHPDPRRPRAPHCGQSWRARGQTPGRACGACQRPRPWLRHLRPRPPRQSPWRPASPAAAGRRPPCPAARPAPAGARRRRPRGPPASACSAFATGTGAWSAWCTWGSSAGRTWAGRKPSAEPSAAPSARRRPAASGGASACRTCHRSQRRSRSRCHSLRRGSTAAVPEPAHWRASPKR
mmetsp:Transcript_101963/g.297374  ORF Transcript_101963/g.297374 Transcript_101963/m.297374 type:complete len:204 (-) Transcript_101963:265-876(-)